MRYVTSANVACGFHGGDPSVMRRTVGLAVAGGVAIGAHPGFADLVGFGRREIQMGDREVEDVVAYQIGALAGVAAAAEARLHHVKLHGALYNIGGSRPRPGRRGCPRGRRGRLDTDPVRACRVLSDRSGRSGWAADRRGGVCGPAYRADGSLVPRDQPGAVIDDPKVVVNRALRIVQDGTIGAISGEVIELRGDTMCLHGDTPGAGGLAARLRSSFEGAGIRVLPIGMGGRRMRPEGRRQKKPEGCAVFSPVRQSRRTGDCL